MRKHILIITSAIAIALVLCLTKGVSCANGNAHDSFVLDFAQYEKLSFEQKGGLEWNDYTNIFSHVKIFEHRKIMLNTAPAEKLFDNVIVKTIGTLQHRDPSQTSVIVLGETRWMTANVSKPSKNAETLLMEFVPEKFNYFGICNRPSIVGLMPESELDLYPPDWRKKLPITNANFIAYFLPVDFVNYCYNNLAITMCYVPTTEDYWKSRSPDYLLSDDDWLFAANRINSLFDGDVALLSQRKDIKLLQSKGMTLSLTERKTLPEGESVTLRWSVPTELKDCWIRFDTSEGRASIEDEKAQTVTVSHIPTKTPVTATLYAISPDGKEWRYTTLAIPATKK